MNNLRIELAKNLKPKPQDETKLGFGDIFTDHMFLMDYDEGQGWHDARIVPYGPLPLDPAAMALHYSQEVFEGMKAYRAEDGRILLFRPQENFARLNRSNDRVCIPQIDEEFALQALIELLKIEKDWVPHLKDTSLYIRPFIIASDAHLGVRPANSYLFVIILSPSGPYYKEGLNPVKLYVENNYVRTVRGGTGMAKTGGNYAASLKAQVEAHEQNYSQVLWLDGVEKKYIEEVGAMNVFFVIDGEVITPELVGSILPGITRKSCIEMLRGMGYKVTERRLSIQEVAEAYKAGKLDEAFGTGTAAVISPIGHIKWGDLIMDINNNEIGDISMKLYNELTGLQWGRIPDPYGWVVEVK
ncbi:branched-chain amino acid aminotransferase [Zongyangia hominis]|uniref:Branched-chain-amino-acid aminotransferase n=1 Tax=Zongyangia hominis TaxID=2763677 RepID=A0A926ED72_9FIRM|nr:branched-chain amino acid aminotransferase [Zongyangia hominis]MBC8570054.1 branched-chain amino acid aminotransferase [Zongyangia hominis]